jgi:hypothetical protein
MVICATPIPNRRCTSGQGSKIGSVSSRSSPITSSVVGPPMWVIQVWDTQLPRVLYGPGQGVVGDLLPAFLCGPQVGVVGVFLDLGHALGGG